MLIDDERRVYNKTTFDFCKRYICTEFCVFGGGLLKISHSSIFRYYSHWCIITYGWFIFTFINFISHNFSLAYEAFLFLWDFTRLSLRTFCWLSRTWNYVPQLPVRAQNAVDLLTKCSSLFTGLTDCTHFVKISHHQKVKVKEWSNPFILVIIKHCLAYILHFTFLELKEEIT